MAKDRQSNGGHVKNQRTSESGYNWINALSLIVGIAALGVAWNANMIAQQGNQLTANQSRPQVVVLGEKRIAQDLLGNIGTDSIVRDAVLACAQQIRLANLGSTNDSIVGFQTTIQYDQTTSTLMNTGEARSVYDFTMAPGQNPARVAFEVSDALRVIMYWVELSFVDEEAASSMDAINGSEPIELPYVIPGSEALDLVLAIRYPISADHEFNLDNEYGQVMFAQQPAVLKSVNFAIQFVMASSSVVETPYMKCGAVGR